MSQPQFDITPYSERSFVIRTNPPRFLQSYGGHLAPLGCKWNSNLKANPNDPSQGTLAGWICSKKNEQLVMSVLNQINSGQLPPLSTQEFHSQKTNQPQQQRSQNTVVTPQQPTQMNTSSTQMRPSPGMVSSLFGQSPPAQPKQAPLSLTPQVPVTRETVRNILAPVVGLPGATSREYQPIVVQVLRPTEGKTLQLNIGGQQIPITVESTQSENDTVVSAIVTLSDGQRTKIQLNQEKAHWYIPGFANEHSITLS
jgi:hypothetical protein